MTPDIFAEWLKRQNYKNIQDRKRLLAQIRVLALISPFITELTYKGIQRILGFKRKAILSENLKGLPVFIEKQHKAEGCRKT